MLFPPQTQETLDKTEKLLSSHLETGEKQNNGGGEWSQFSMGSSEMGKLASPFDDIGFLAGGPGPAMDPAKVDANNGEPPSDSAKHALGNFLATARVEGLKAVEEHQPQRPQLSRRGSARLDKTLSKRDQFGGEDVSLALSAAAGGLERTNATRNLFDFSKNSLGLSALDPPNEKAKNMESSKSSFGASKSSVAKNRSRGHDNKSSFGLLAASRSSDTSVAARSIGSKFSSMMHFKNNEKSKSTESSKMSEDKIKTLETQNLELSKENKLLQAKLKEMEQVIEKQNAMKQWRSIEELASTSVELWQYKSIAILADLQLDRMEERLGAYERLVESKERSICNLEAVRNKQEKRIGYLEVQCLQNGVDIAEEGDKTTDEPEERAQLKGDDETTSDNENSFASFGDDVPLPFKIDYSPAPDKLGTSARSEDSKAMDQEKDQLERSHRSESSRSVGMSDLSGHSNTSESGPSTNPSSWLTLDMAPSEQEAPSSPGFKIKIPNAETRSNGAPLKTYLAASSHASKKEQCLETGTWDPTNMIDFAAESPRDVGVTPPPPPPPDRCIRSDPAPVSRKKAVGPVVSRSPSRSKSPGTRRRLKGTKGEGDAANKLEASRRRRLKDPSAAPSRSALGRSASSASLGKMPAPSRSALLKDPSAAPSRSALSRSASSASLGKMPAPSRTALLKDPSAAPSRSALGRSASSASLGKVSGHRRKLKTSSSKDIKRDLLSNSTHSLGQGSAHRRRQRKENGFDRQTVSTALENALGSSQNVLDMDDHFLRMTPAGEASKFNSGFLVRSKASQAVTVEDEGLDLDDVFRD
jgi:hypothetical protein